jgi:serine/threonine protein kinase
MRKYRLVAKKGEGTFSEVLKAQNVKDGKYHAIKCMKNRFESVDQVRCGTNRFSLLLLLLLCVHYVLFFTVSVFSQGNR